MEHSALAGDMALTNLSHIDYPGESATTWRDVVEWEKATKIALYVPLIFASVVGNSLVVVRLSLCGKLRHSATDVYIMNLAVSDLLVTFTSMWVHLVADLAQKWLFGPVFCQLNSFMQVASLVSSVLTMCSLAADRFFGIVTHLFYGCTRFKTRAALVAFCIWTCSIVTAVPLLVYTREHKRLWRNYDETWCVDMWPPTEKYDESFNMTVYLYPTRKVYYTTLALLLYAFPLVLMVGAYLAIIIKLRRKDALIEISDRRYKDKIVGRRKRVVRMLGLLLAVFAACWLPFQISMLYYEYNVTAEKYNFQAPDWWVHFHFWAMYMSYANSAFNPMIFITFSNKTKKGIKKLFGRATSYDKTTT